MVILRVPPTHYISQVNGNSFNNEPKVVELFATHFLRNSGVNNTASNASLFEPPQLSLSLSLPLAAADFLKIFGANYSFLAGAHPLPFSASGERSQRRRKRFQKLPDAEKNGDFFRGICIPLSLSSFSSWVDSRFQYRS